MSRKLKPQTAFAALDTTTDWIAKWTIHGSATAVRRAIGEVWDKSDPSEGWKAAKIEGMRVVKIELRVLR